MPRVGDGEEASLGERYWTWCKVTGHKDGQLRVAVPSEGVLNVRLAVIIEKRGDYDGPLVRHPTDASAAARHQEGPQRIGRVHKAT